MAIWFGVFKFDYKIVKFHDLNGFLSYKLLLNFPIIWQEGKKLTLKAEEKNISVHLQVGDSVFTTQVQGLRDGRGWGGGVK